MLKKVEREKEVEAGEGREGGKDGRKERAKPYRNAETLPWAPVLSSYYSVLAPIQLLGNFKIAVLTSHPDEENIDGKLLPVEF